MKSRTESIVSGAGVFLSFITTLVDQIKIYGGTIEDLYKLITIEGQDTMNSVARQIVWYSKPRKFKNWQAIYTVLKEVTHNSDLTKIVWANAYASSIDNDWTKRLQLAFPEFWSETEVQGPIPWSMLIKADQDQANWPVNVGCYVVGKFLDAHGILEDFRLPSQKYLYENINDEDGEVLSKAFWDTNRDFFKNNDQLVGKKIVIDGAEVIIVEDNDNNGFMVVVPAECIALDI